MTLTIAQLKQRFEQALAAAFGMDYATVDPILVPASNPKFGDYQSNVAMSLTKRLGKPPRAIAEQLLQQLDVADLCKPPEIAGPGFINLLLKPEYLENQLQAMQADSRLGIASVKQPQRVIVDFPVPILPKKCTLGTYDRPLLETALREFWNFKGIWCCGSTM